ncbi:unnamed protein product [Nippostrongylus brasiliensis]|uniref:Secreted protein n=1 Tax=Nippostrongylus brasiliensis TaxID=27835 RepID=A0A0N4XP17_NIPBR|nr:unnamed protein product [Nippostrongylus brasiliensis]
MIIFAIFSLFAGMLDAVTFLRTEQKACYGWGLSGPHTRSISLHEQPIVALDENGLPTTEKEDLNDDDVILLEVNVE